MKETIIIYIRVIVVTKEKYGVSKHSARFDTERKCHDFLVQIRWNGKPQCPSCKNDIMNYYLASRNIYKCARCYKQFSVIKGTIFERSKVPLTKWFAAIYFFTTKKRGVSSCQMAQWLEVKQHTAWFMMHRLREALKEENNIVLKGIVEADETFVGPKINRDLRLQMAKKKLEEEQEEIHGMTEGKKRKHRGFPAKLGRKKGDTNEVLKQRKLEKDAKGERKYFEKYTIILGMMERDGKIVMKKIGYSRTDINRENVHPHLKKHISSESDLYTDQSKVYIGVKNIFPTHKVVNHSKKSYVQNDTHINGVENAWKHLKKTIEGTYFHLSRWHFDRYLGETTYRWNRRKESGKILVEDFMPLIIGKGITYKELKKMNPKRLAA